MSDHANSPQQLRFYVSLVASDDFESALRENGLIFERASVTGATIGAAELVQFLVAVGGGAGLSALIRVVVDACRRPRGKVKVQRKGELISLENYSVKEVEQLLKAIHKEANNATAKDGTRSR